MSYDTWIDAQPGGLEDAAGWESNARQQAVEAFHELPPRLRFRQRRLQKKSTRRRLDNLAYWKRQRREDRNAQTVL